MATKFLKDKWILHAIKHKYIVPNKDGTILRCDRASAKGELLSPNYSLVKYRVHKASGRVYFNMVWMGIKKSVLVNRVIALAFLPNPSNLPQVNHIDGNKENNALFQADGSYQLEWSTGADNERHAHRNGLKSGRGSQNSNAKLNAEIVLAIREMSEQNVPVLEIADKFDIARSTVANVVKRKTWSHI